MSWVTSTLNRSTSITTDLLLSTGFGAGVGGIVALAPLEWIPIVGPFLPYASAAAVATAVYHRQRTNLKNGPASF